MYAEFEELEKYYSETITGHDKYTGEEVEYETFDPIVFENLGHLEHEENDASAHEHGAYDSWQEHCDFCQEDAQEEMNMYVAVVGFGTFSLILFLMWYMLRSCKDSKPD